LVINPCAWAGETFDQTTEQIRSELQHVSADFPFIIHSKEIDDRLSADIYGSIAWPFINVSEAIGMPANWCEFMPLNLNIKACVVQHKNGQPVIVLYAGRKYYEPPEDAYQLAYQFSFHRENERASVVLKAKEGPMGTRDYRINIDAIPDGESTLIHIHSSYRTSFTSRLGTQAYLATLGSDKIGFSVEKYTVQGKPVYIKGLRGIIERNAMRYYLALLTFVETANIPQAQKFEARIATWFDMTENYAAQLHELGRDEYLDAKRKEWRNQQALQSR